MDMKKEKCKVLKQVRKKMADALDIDLHQTECTYEGACSGTCPKCKQEEEMLNRALLKRTAMVASVGMLSVGLSGCQTITEGALPIFENMSGGGVTDEIEIMGDMEYIPPEELEGEDEYDPFEDDETIGIFDSSENNIEDTSTEMFELEGDIVYIPEEEELEDIQGEAQ